MSTWCPLGQNGGDRLYILLTSYENHWTTAKCIQIDESQTYIWVKKAICGKNPSLSLHVYEFQEHKQLNNILFRDIQI